MPALSASSCVPGCSMPFSSHITNVGARGYDRTIRNDFTAAVSHNRNMARRGVPNRINWFLREWMDYTEEFSGRGGQERMRKQTGWSKATMSQLYNNQQDYSPKLVNEAAEALNVAPYELLMKPETAMALRRLRQDALRVVEDGRELDITPPKRRRSA
jgi:transcriptional regulator with XRE-family HTH domain